MLLPTINDVILVRLNAEVTYLAIVAGIERRWGKESPIQIKLYRQRGRGKPEKYYIPLTDVVGIVTPIT